MELLRKQDLPEYEEHVCDAVVRTAERLSGSRRATSVLDAEIGPPAPDQLIQRERLGSAPGERGGEQRASVARRLGGCELVARVVGLGDDDSRFALVARVIAVYAHSR